MMATTGTTKLSLRRSLKKNRINEIYENISSAKNMGKKKKKIKSKT
jgi:hypothetical protein